MEDPAATPALWLDLSLISGSGGSYVRRSRYLVLIGSFPRPLQDSSRAPSCVESSRGRG